MAGRFLRGLVTGLVVGLGGAAVVSVLVLPPVDRTTPDAPEPVTIERSYGPPANSLPRLTSESSPPAPSTPQGDE